MNAQKKAKAALELAAKWIKQYYNQSVQKVPFKKGDKVLLNLRDWQKTGRKFKPKGHEPFVIKEQLSPVTFKLEWPKDLVKIHPVFHASKLIPYVESSFLLQKAKCPPPITIDGQYEVEKILDARRQERSRKLEFLVRWKGYTINDDTWEPEVNLKGSQEAIQTFYKKHPRAIH